MRLSDARLLALAAAALYMLPMSASAKPKAKKVVADVAVAQADIKDANGASVGSASFFKSAHGVKVKATVHGLSPGAHGIHFHENGKCDGPDFKSAGGHLNPDHKDHGLSSPKGPHAGDMPNLIVGGDGTGVYQYTSDRVSLDPAAPNSLLKDGGTAIVVHAKLDDQKTSPSGDSGDRIACGIISKVSN